MSKTEKKNGMRVQGAVLEIGRGRGGGAAAMFCVREVARQAIVSKPTARKYLEILEKHGFIEKSRHAGTDLYWIKMLGGGEK